MTGEQSQVRVCRSPKLTPEKKQGTSQDPDDEVFEADEDGEVEDHHGDVESHHGSEVNHHGEDDEEVVLQIERDHRVEVNATPPSKIITRTFHFSSYVYPEFVSFSYFDCINY